MTIPHPGLAVVLAAFAGCSSAPGELHGPCDPCDLVDANNYNYEASLLVETLEVPEETDLLVDWSALSQDLRGLPLDPLEDVDFAALYVFQGLTPDEVAQGLATDTLDQAVLTLYMNCMPEEASCLLSQFSFFGNFLDVQQYLQEGRGVWVVALHSYDEASALAAAFFTPKAGGQVGEIDLADHAAGLELEADLDSLEPVYVEPGEPEIQVNWGALTRDGLGNHLSLSGIDGVMVASFHEELSTLEQDFKILETMAQETWTTPVDGQTSLSLGVLDGPRPFPGVDRDAVWLMALTCSTCRNPSPRFLTRLEPLGGELPGWYLGR